MEANNAAAMREALEVMCKAAQEVFCSFARETFYGERRLDSLGVAFDKAKAALSAPARNCDLYDNWYDAHQAWERLPKDEIGYFVAANGVHECEQAWLLAPAEEGGAE